MNTKKSKKLKMLLNNPIYCGLLSFKSSDETITPKDKRFSKYANQLIKRGFDDTETWNLAATLGRWLLPRLKRYKKIQNGTPFNLTEKKWDHILDNIIWFVNELAYHKEIDEIEDKLLSKNVPIKDISNHAMYVEYRNKYEKCKQQFMEYLEDLWW